MSIIFSHPTANANVRFALAGLAKAGLLAEFHTSLACFPGNILNRLSGLSAFKEIRRRSFDPLFQNLTYMHPSYEIGRMLASKSGFGRLIKHETGIFSIDSVYNQLDKQVAKRLQQGKVKGVNAVYSYEDGAAGTFRKAKQLDMKCIYDLPIGYWRSAQKLLKEEEQKNPEWAATLSGFKDSVAKLRRKDEELNLAGKIFVASQFTANTLDEYPGTLASIEVIPYGFPPVNRDGLRKETTMRRPLKLLFVGGLSQRKGISYLFEAVDGLKGEVELTIVGQKGVFECEALNKELGKHKWIPGLPQEKILELMKANDVLVFPSLFEGFGLVITEAMSQGTPVITTARTAGPDLIVNGTNGWLIEAGSTSALRKALEYLLNFPAKLMEAGEAAIETATARPWEVYGTELANSIIKYLNSTG